MYVEQSTPSRQADTEQMDFQSVKNDVAGSTSHPESCARSPVAGDQTIVESKRIESFTSKRITSTTEVCMTRV